MISKEFRLFIRKTLGLFLSELGEVFKPFLQTPVLSADRQELSILFDFVAIYRLLLTRDTQELHVCVLKFLFLPLFTCNIG